jgi:hypothetical protein
MFSPMACLKGNAVINLSSSSAVSWPTPPSAAVAPVSPVLPVSGAPALSGGGSERQTGARSDQGGRAMVFTVTGQRPAQGQGQDQGPVPLAGEPTAPGRHAQGDLQERAAQRQADLDAQAARDRAKQAMEHLREVLTNVWQASASVVDRALGRENTDAVPGPRSDTAPDLSQVAATLVARRAPVFIAARSAQPASSGLPSLPHAPQDDSTAAEVMAYDERGNSSLAPLETGSLISHRV